MFLLLSYKIMWEKSNVNFYNKIILKIAIFLIWFWSFLWYVDAATIESTSIVYEIL